ncbi:MAG: flagellar hook-basal body complex protein [Planctomycetota bacterium]|jgi:flagellar hook protein FlgE
MGLTSALSTALTGMTAAESQIDVLGNNLANSQTVGFKASEVVFSTQFLQTMSIGALPTTDNGGRNPRQTGLGVQIAAINQNFRQGAIEISSSATDLAIQGEGFFQVSGAQEEKLYTRNGIFRLNSSNELVNSDGFRLLGFGVDDDFTIQPTQLVPLTIPVGTETIAKETSKVDLEGTLTPRGDIGNVSNVIQSAVLGNGRIPRPSSTGMSAVGSNPPATASVAFSTTQGAGGNHAEGSVYQYRFVYVDTNGKESNVSSTLSYTVPAGNGLADNTISLNLPPASTQYNQVSVYRTAPGGSDFYLVGSGAAGTTFQDTSAASSSTALNTNVLAGNYSYLVTYYKNGEPESKPSPLVGPVSLANGRAFLTGFPTPPVPAPGSGLPAYDSIRIYRNVANDPNSFYLVDTIAPTGTYTDNRTDADISNLSLPGRQKVNLDGPSVDAATRLVDVTTRDGLNYSNPFKEGELSFRGRKGGRYLDEKTLQITSGTTVQELMDFFERSLGIINESGDPFNPIASTQNTIVGESGTLSPSAYINNGSIRVVSNAGTQNNVTIDLSAIRIKDSNGQISTPSIPFSSVQDGKGQSAVTDFLAYDSLGFPIKVRITAVLEARTDQSTIYRWFADSPDNLSSSGAGINVGTGILRFDGNGNYISSTNSSVVINRVGFPSEKPLLIDLNFSSLNGLATSTSSLAASRQDGSPPGVLNNYVIGEDGKIRGVFSNGISRDLGQLQIARFINPMGLEQRGRNMYAPSVNSGLPIQGAPSENGLGVITAGALELSNTDVGNDLVQLVLASTQYRSNARVITATQQLFEELLNLRR